jgi:hypothetical protein
MDSYTPRWLMWLEKRCGWIAVQNLAIILITLQVLGFLMVASDPMWMGRLALFPDLVMQGEVWRVVTFLSLPLSMSPLWVLFALWFLYFIVNSIENHWGATRTTLYVVFSWAATCVYSLVTGYSVTSIAHFESTLFFAAAALFPDFEVSLFMILPVKLKILALVSGAFVLYQFFNEDWTGRGHLVVVYSSFFLFFGPAILERIRQFRRRSKYRDSFR